MNHKKIALTALVASVTAFAAVTAQAATYQSFLEYTSVGAFGSTSGSALGIPKLVTPAVVVTVTEGGLNGNGRYTYLNVDVQLASGFRLIDTGSHELFSYNLSQPTAVTVSFVEPNKFQTFVGAPGANSPFGPSFTNAVTCAPAFGCGANPGGSPGNHLLFRITDKAGGVDGIEVGPPLHATNALINQLLSTSDGWWFAADASNTNGNTGTIGARDFVVFTAVPEPGTYALMLAGLGIMGFVGHRRKKQQAA